MDLDWTRGTGDLALAILPITRFRTVGVSSYPKDALPIKKRLFVRIIMKDTRNASFGHPPTA